MAEKEERILIKKQINYHPPYGGWCGDGEEIILTRSEALEKIGFAIQERMRTAQNCHELAEAALNALLSE